VLDADRSDMIRAFGRPHHVRYDESTATRLPEMARLAMAKYHGDLRRLPAGSNHETAGVTRLLKEFRGIGDTGADIFLREGQDVWTWARPYFDNKALAPARKLGLPTDPKQLARLAPRANARLAEALIRVSLNEQIRKQVMR
jgi:hypothetical protein